MTRYESKPRPLPGTWADNAACKNTSVAFFPDLEGLSPGSGAGTRWATPALQLCARCSVREECLTHAIDNNETDGVWGGTLPKDRASIARGRTPTGPDASHCANGHLWADNEMRAQTTTRSLSLIHI